MFRFLTDFTFIFRYCFSNINYFQYIYYSFNFNMRDHSHITKAKSERGFQSTPKMAYKGARMSKNDKMA